MADLQSRAEQSLKSDAVTAPNLQQATAGGAGSNTTVYEVQNGRGNVHGVTITPDVVDANIANLVGGRAELSINGVDVFSIPLIDLFYNADKVSFINIFAMQNSTMRLTVVDASGVAYDVIYTFWYNILTPEEEQAMIEQMTGQTEWS